MSEHRTELTAASTHYSGLRVFVERGRFVAYALVFFALAFRTYKGNAHIFYTDLYQYVRGIGSYANDIYINESFALESSILYDVVRVTGLNLDNDFIGFGLYLVFVTVAACSVGLILRHFFKIPTLDTIIVIVLLVTSLQAPLLRSVKAGVLFPFSNTPTTYAFSLMFPFLYLVLRRHLFAAAVICSLMLALTVKPSWSPLLIAIVAIAIDRQTPRLQLAWFLIPIGVAVLLSGNVTIPSDAAVRLELSQAVILHDHMEDTLFLQPTFRLALFAASFPVFFLLARKLDDHRLRNLCWSILIVTVAITVIGGSYTAWGYNVIPNPLFFILSPVRATNVYHLFFFLLVFHYLFTTPRFTWYQRTAFILVIFLLTAGTAVSGSLSLNRILLSGVVVVGGIVYTTLDRAFAFKHQWPIVKLIRSYAPSAMVLALLVFTFFALITARHTVYKLTTLNEKGLEDFQKWTLPFYDPAMFESLLVLRSCRQDFTLAVLDEPQPKYVPKTIYTGGQVLIEANFVAAKSKFIGDAVHLYFNLPAYHEARNREELGRVLGLSLRQGRMPSSSVISDLKERNVAFLMPDRLAEPLAMSVPTRPVAAGMMLAVFEKDGRVAASLDECGVGGV